MLLSDRLTFLGKKVMTVLTAPRPTQNCKVSHSSHIRFAHLEMARESRVNIFEYFCVVYD